MFAAALAIPAGSLGASGNRGGSQLILCKSTSSGETPTTKRRPGSQAACSLGLWEGGRESLRRRGALGGRWALRRPSQGGSATARGNLIGDSGADAAVAQNFQRCCAAIASPEQTMSPFHWHQCGQSFVRRLHAAPGSPGGIACSARWHGGEGTSMAFSPHPPPGVGSIGTYRGRLAMPDVSFPSRHAICKAAGGSCM